MRPFPSCWMGSLTLLGLSLTLSELWRVLGLREPGASPGEPQGAHSVKWMIEAA